MKKYLLAAYLLTFFLFLTLVVSAAPSPREATNSSSRGTKKTLDLPPAVDKSDVISLGTAIDPGTLEVVEGYAIIHPKKAKSVKNNKSKAGATVCYAYLSKGAKWKSVEPWVSNTANLDGLNETTVFNLLQNGVAKWEDATDGVVGNGLGVDVLGVGATTSASLEADTQAPDNQNEVYFADISDSNAIAVTIVWGVFGGPVQRRRLVEWDQVYDDVTFDWSAEAAGVPNKMDFDNIATHEVGHGFGLGDLYNSCTDETMFGYADYAEIKKRDLNTGDIKGVNSLY